GHLRQEVRRLLERPQEIRVREDLRQRPRGGRRGGPKATEDLRLGWAFRHRNPSSRSAASSSWCGPTGGRTTFPSNPCAATAPAPCARASRTCSATSTKRRSGHTASARS